MASGISTSLGMGIFIPEGRSLFKAFHITKVLPLCRKLLEYSKLETLTADSKKDVEDLLSSTKEIPKAFWEGVCKVCGIDKDDSSVLLCDMCDGEYHTYCLNPPLYPEQGTPEVTSNVEICKCIRCYTA